MVLSLLLMVFGIGALCALLYKAVAYALPVTVGIEASLWAMNAGAGSVGGIVVGFLAGGLTFALGQFVLATTRSNVLRLIVVLAFVIPAVIAGWGVPSMLWRHVFAATGAGIVGCTAFMRLVLPFGGSQLPAGFGGAR